MNRQRLINRAVFVLLILIVGGIAIRRADRTEPPGEVIPELPRFLDIGSNKCKACKKMIPIIGELEKEYEGRVVIEFIDLNETPRVSREYGIRVIPTQVFYDRDGVEVWRHEGFFAKDEIVGKFNELKWIGDGADAADKSTPGTG